MTGKTIAENIWPSVADGDREVIRAYEAPLKEHAGYVVLSGNIFDSAGDQDERHRRANSASAS